MSRHDRTRDRRACFERGDEDKDFNDLPLIADHTKGKEK